MTSDVERDACRRVLEVLGRGSKTMIALALSLTVGGGAVQQTPLLFFDHGSFCQQMQEAAGQEEVRAGTVIDRWTKHGGIRVDCDHRVVDVRTLLSRPVTKSWLKTEQRNWTDDICSDAAVAEATANGWKVIASSVAEGKVVAVFEATCKTGG
jgi:hypothetical protein